MSVTQPLWIGLKAANIFLHAKYTQVLLMVPLLVQISSGALSNCAEDGKESRGCNFQPEIEAAILGNLKNSIKGNLLVSCCKERTSFRTLLVML